MDDKGEISDGYHTFNELYAHRHALYIALCRLHWARHPDRVWRSQRHHDGSTYDGWFILGIEYEPGKQITYHLPLERWDETTWANTEKRAPEWDGHTSADVIYRLGKLAP